MTYKGDSPGKKIIRFKAWSTAFEIMTILDAVYQGVYVLSGEGGDIGVLRGLGIREGITAADMDLDCYEFVKELYPHAAHLFGEAGKLSKQARYNAFHMDFCGSLTTSNLETFVNVARNANSYPCIGILTIMNGREVRTTKELPPGLSLKRGTTRSERRQMYRQMEKSQIPGREILKNKLNPTLEINRAKASLLEVYDWENDPFMASMFTKGKKLSAFGNAYAKIDAFKYCAETVLRKDGLRLWGTSGFTYHSKSRHSHGTPFVTGVVVISKESQLEDMCGTLGRFANQIYRFDAMTASTARTWLRPIILSMANTASAEQLSQLFDIPIKTIIAWKAHQTMGTYSRPAGKTLMGRERGRTLHSVGVSIDVDEEKGTVGYTTTAGLPPNYPIPMPRKLKAYTGGDPIVAMRAVLREQKLLYTGWGTIAVHADPSELELRELLIAKNGSLLQDQNIQRRISEKEAVLLALHGHPPWINTDPLTGESSHG